MGQKGLERFTFAGGSGECLQSLVALRAVDATALLGLEGYPGRNAASLARGDVNVASLGTLWPRISLRARAWCRLPVSLVMVGCLPGSGAAGDGLPGRGLPLRVCLPGPGGLLILACCTAGLASFRWMLESPLGVELLLSNCEYEFLTAVGAGDCLVLEFHLSRLSPYSYTAIVKQLHTISGVRFSSHTLACHDARVGGCQALSR